MKLNTKKLLAVKTLGVGKGRIVFNRERLEEIKDAITKQDIRDLIESGAIIIRENNGRRTVLRRRTRRRAGSVRKKVNQSKREYVIRTRKLRAYLVELLLHGKISKEQYKILRTQIKASIFRSKAHLKEHLAPHSP